MHPSLTIIVPKKFDLFFYFLLMFLLNFFIIVKRVKSIQKKHRTGKEYFLTILCLLIDYVIQVSSDSMLQFYDLGSTK